MTEDDEIRLRYCRLAEETYTSIMSIPVEKLAEEALALPSEARALLADRLVESLDPLTDDEVRASWVNEAVRRRDEVRAGIIETVSGDVVKERIRDLIQK
jgi:Mn-dependent DtxR family transcriptional regulator